MIMMNLCKCGCGETTNRNFVQGHNVRLLQREGPNNNMWRGGISINNSGGYIEIRKPDHHFATQRGYVREHRLVYEEYYKCSLLPWTIVHHINGIKTDNRIENLEAVISNGNHIRTHHRVDWSNTICSNCGSDKTLTRYISSRDYTHHYWYKDMDDKTKYLCNKCHEKQKRRKQDLCVMY